MVKVDLQNILVAGGLAVGVALLACFLAVLLGSSQGEAASALGSVMGGAMGAGGAGYSVYYSLTRQREDEIQKVSKAVLAEVAVMVKYVVGHLNLCEMIQSGLQLPKAELRNALLTPEPIVYKAVANNISRLPRPTQVVNFYTRMAEIDGIATLIINSPSPGPNIAPNDVSGLADLLITQCQVAEAILANVTADQTAESVLAEGLRLQMLAAVVNNCSTQRCISPIRKRLDEWIRRLCTSALVSLCQTRARPVLRSQSMALLTRAGAEYYFLPSRYYGE